MSFKLYIPVIILIPIALAACASGPHPVAELSQAHTLIDQAEQAGAQQFSAADLDSARTKLQRAEQKDQKEDLALRLSQEASMDAQVALARTRLGKAEQALTEVNASIESLRKETNRTEKP